MENSKTLSPSVLAFVGDAVYGLCARERLARVNRPSGELHRLSVGLVSASAQAGAFKRIEARLCPEELSIFKRGRNAHIGNVPKGASPGEYHTATGMECLFGYLYLSGNAARMNELFEWIWSDFSQES